LNGPVGYRGSRGALQALYGLLRAPARLLPSVVLKLARGASFVSGHPLVPPEYEKNVAAVLFDLTLRINSLTEVGCGGVLPPRQPSPPDEVTCCVT